MTHNMGSVKDFTVIEPAQAGKLGLGKFTFSNRYSVFDWGQMPDDIADKGASLCITSAYFFERLEEMGIKTHYLGVVEDGCAKRLKDVKNPQSAMQIKLVRVVRPSIVSLRGAQGATKQSPNPPSPPFFKGGNKGGFREIAAAPLGPRNDTYDYSPFKSERTNFLIPLEVIYRNSLPEGSSVFKRLKLGTLKLEALGLKEMPAPGTMLATPLFDVSTKLESTDRYLSWNEAKDIAGLSEQELQDLKKAVMDIDNLLTKEAGKAGLVNEDGKVEFGFDENRNLMLLDTVGTLDECRFTFNGLPVSKEILRKHYRGGAWHNEVEDAKKNGGIEWKRLVKSRPNPLSPELKQLASDMYKSACNELTGREWFKGVNGIKEILKEIAK